MTIKMLQNNLVKNYIYIAIHCKFDF